MEVTTNISINEIIGEVCGTKMSLSELRKLYVREEIKNELTNRICETGNATYMRELAKQIKELGEENLKKLTYAISQTKEVEEKCDFVAEIEDLTEENIDILLQSIFFPSEEESPKQKRKIA